VLDALYGEGGALLDPKSNGARRNASEQVRSGMDDIGDDQL